MLSKSPFWWGCQLKLVTLLDFLNTVKIIRNFNFIFNFWNRMKSCVISPDDRTKILLGVGALWAGALSQSSSQFIPCQKPGNLFSCIHCKTSQQKLEFTAWPTGTNSSDVTVNNHYALDVAFWQFCFLGLKKWLLLCFQGITTNPALISYSPGQGFICWGELLKLHAGDKFHCNAHD